MGYPREVTYTISTILCGVFWECAYLKAVASGYITNYYSDIWAHPVYTFIWIFGIPFWRHLHFWFVHRAMHPWNTETFPDVGLFLFNIAHCLHHQSKNFDTWSGISMHPIEGWLYDNATMIPWFFFHHPLVINVCMIDLHLGAMLGHDGYDYP